MRSLGKTAFHQIVQFGEAPRLLDNGLFADSLKHTEMSSVPSGGHVLRITIHVHKTSTLISSLDRFSSLKDANHAQNWKAEKCHSYGAVFELLFRENSKFQDMLKHLRHHAPGLNLRNVLEQIEASPALPEIMQPKGFCTGLELHKYQRQTLCWMCTAEDTRLREKLWICVNRKVRFATSCVCAHFLSLACCLQNNGAIHCTYVLRHVT